MLLSIAAYLGFYFLTLLWALIVLRVVHSIGFAAVSVTLLVLAIDSRPNASRAATFGIYSIFCFAGYALGPMGGERIAAAMSSQAVFLSSALLTAFVLPIALLSDDVSAAPAKETSKKNAVLGSFANIKLNRVHAFLVLVTVPLATAETFVPTFARASRLGNVGPFFFTFAVAMVVARLLVGKLLAVGNRYATMLLGSCLCLGAMTILAFGHSHAWLIIAALLMGLGWGIFFPVALDLSLEISGNQSARNQALFSCTYDFAFFAGQLGVGLLIDRYDYRPSFMFAAGLVAICSIGVAAHVVPLRHQKRIASWRREG